MMEYNRLLAELKTQLALSHRGPGEPGEMVKVKVSRWFIDQLHDTWSGPLQLRAELLPNGEYHFIVRALSGYHAEAVFNQVMDVP